MEILKYLISPGCAVADIGANVGVYTYALSQTVGTHGKVYAFEPIVDNFSILTALVKSAHLTNAFVFQAALGESPDECDMVIPEMDGFTDYYWAHVARPGDEGRKEKVRVLALDELSQDGAIDTLSFIKCDVEGEELSVIRGGIETIRIQKPGCLFEVSKRTCDEVFVTFKNLKYRAFVLDRGLVEVDQFKDHYFSNYFFLHPSSETWRRLGQFSNLLPVIENQKMPSR